jgi:hypothetical protein
MSRCATYGLSEEDCDNCYYCDTPLATRHEHDHFPVSKLCGGTRVVPTCLNCHDLKDRDSWESFDIGALAEAVIELSVLGYVGKFCTNCGEEIVGVKNGDIFYPKCNCIDILDTSMVILDKYRFDDFSHRTDRIGILGDMMEHCRNIEENWNMVSQIARIYYASSVRLLEHLTLGACK